MKADLIFDNVEFLAATNGQAIRVAVGQTFRVNLKDVTGSVDWFMDYDPVFDVVVEGDGKTAAFTAKAIGPSALQLQVAEKIEMRLKFEVFAPPTEATRLEHPAPVIEPLA